MTATDELRDGLTKRGIKWRWEDERTTYWYVTVDGEEWGEWTAIEMGGYLHLSFSSGDVLTPAQAIAATLGPGTCHDLGGTGANGEQVFNCSECGCVLSLYDRDGSNNLCTSFIFDYPRHCPECGRKVVDE